MARDFLKFVTRPSSLAKKLKNLTIGSLFAATGLSASAEPIVPITALPAVDPQVSLVDKARKIGKLVLRLPGTSPSLASQHRSHSSHRSHYSSSSGGGGGAAPTPAPTVRPVAPMVIPPAAPTSLAALPANSAFGEITSMDQSSRTITVKITQNVFRSLSYRDDTKFENSFGASVRFDDFAATKGGLPVSQGDKVEFTWRMSADGRTSIIATIKPK